MCTISQTIFTSRGQSASCQMKRDIHSIRGLGWVCCALQKEHQEGGGGLEFLVPSLSRKKQARVRTSRPDMGHVHFLIHFWAKWKFAGWNLLSVQSVYDDPSFTGCIGTAFSFWPADELLTSLPWSRSCCTPSHRSSVIASSALSLLVEQTYCMCMYSTTAIIEWGRSYQRAQMGKEPLLKIQANRASAYIYRQQSWNCQKVFTASLWTQASLGLCRSMRKRLQGSM